MVEEGVDLQHVARLDRLPCSRMRSSNSFMNPTGVVGCERSMVRYGEPHAWQSTLRASIDYPNVFLDARVVDMYSRERIRCRRKVEPVQQNMGPSCAIRRSVDQNLNL